MRDGELRDVATMSPAFTASIAEGIMSTPPIATWSPFPAPTITRRAASAMSSLSKKPPLMSG